MRSVNKAVLLAAFVFAQNSMADEVSFSHKDWELACDNTRTCRVRNYGGCHQGSIFPVRMAMLLTRKAGQHTPVTIDFESFMVNEKNEWKSIGRTEMQVGDISTSDFETFINDKININSLVKVMSNSEDMLFSGEAYQCKFSLAGLKAVLLKMDEVQGRVGTPGALIAKGTKPEKQVLPPVPVKTLVVPLIPPTTKKDWKLLDAVADFLDSKCEGEINLCRESRTIERLSKEKLLVSQQDGLQGLTTIGISVFIINNYRPYNPIPAVGCQEIISCDDNEEERIVEKGVIKSCGYSGGCWDTISWAWTGNAFEKASETTGCVPGGAVWELPRVISKVVNKNKKVK